MTGAVEFHGAKRNASVEAAIRRWIERIELAGVRLDECYVTITSRSHAFEVELALALRGGSHFIVHPDPARRSAHEDVYVAVADAFRAVWRQISRPLPHRTPGPHPDRGAVPATRHRRTPGETP